MKRFPFVIGSTIAGLAGVLGFHSQNTMHALTNALPITSRGPQGAARSAGYPVNRVNPASTVPAGSPQVSPTTSAVGNREQYGYGILSVRVTVSGSKVVSLQVADLQTADSYSQQIANQVIPYLRREVLAAQSARIQGISGATYTSEAYASSVQSALDKLHVK